jgi:hypothetical protein
MPERDLYLVEDDFGTAGGLAYRPLAGSCR